MEKLDDVLRQQGEERARGGEGVAEGNVTLLVPVIFFGFLPTVT